MLIAKKFWALYMITMSQVSGSTPVSKMMLKIYVNVTQVTLDAI